MQKLPLRRHEAYYKQEESLCPGMWKTLEHYDCVIVGPAPCALYQKSLRYVKPKVCVSCRVQAMLSAESAHMDKSAFLGFGAPIIPS